jgi:ABC-type spermidine/putrescine transport system permease subunit II
MITFLSLFLQCGAFLLTPMVIFGIGLWLINKYVGAENPRTLTLIAIVIGFSFFGATFVGMVIDPRGGFLKLSEIIKTAGLVGGTVSLSIVVFVHVYRCVVKMFQN